MKTPIKILLIIALVAALFVGGIALAIFSLTRRIDRSELWLYDLDTGQTVRLTGSGSNVTPAFSPDGKFLVYAHRIPASRGKAASSTIEMLTLEKGAENTIIDNGGYNYSPTWSPDMRSIYYASDHGGQRDIWELELETAVSKKITDDKASEREPRLSRDGKWILFTQRAETGGIDEIHIIPSGGGDKIRLTETKNILQMPKSPAWLPDSKGIAFFRLVEIAIMDLEGNIKGVISLAGLNNLDELRFNPTRPEIIFKGRPARELSFQFYLYSFTFENNELRPVRKSGFVETGYTFSPDGRQIVFSK